MPTVKQRLRQEVLRQRGLTQGSYGKLNKETRVVHPVESLTDPRDTRKTHHMRLLESHFQQPIEELLDPRLSLSYIANKLAIDVTTVSKWRYRLGLRSGNGKHSSQ